MDPRENRPTSRLERTAEAAAQPEQPLEVCRIRLDMLAGADHEAAL